MGIQTIVDPEGGKTGRAKIDVKIFLLETFFRWTSIIPVCLCVSVGMCGCVCICECVWVCVGGCVGGCVGVCGRVGMSAALMR